MRILLTALLALLLAAPAFANGDLPRPEDCEPTDDQVGLYVRRVAPPELWLCGLNGWERVAEQGATGAQGAPGIPGPTCVSYVLWSACSPTGITNCTIVGAGCAAVTNVAAVGSRGAVVALDMDTFSHCRLRYAGAMAAAQTGTVTVKLRSYSDGAGTDWIATTFNSGLTCADRSSAVADLSAKTGLHFAGLQLGSSATTDDPLLTAITLTCCNQTFTW